MVRALMLVSASVDEALRHQVAQGTRPTPEYLKLEQVHGVQLLDWSRAGFGPGRRSVGRSLRHALAALHTRPGADVIFSDGEHVGVPLAVAMDAMRIRVPHMVIGHHLLTPAKERVFRHLRAARRIDRVVVHSSNQVAAVVDRLGFRPEQVVVVPYGVDAAFWAGGSAGAEEDGLVVSAGREHRDYRTLVEALPAGVRLSIADHSLYTPHATRRDPLQWPDRVERVGVDPRGLRDLYRRASVVAVPVMRSTMPAGITTLLEAMAMGKAVVVTETPELAGVVADGRTGLTVPAGDTAAMRSALEVLLDSPELRRRLGKRARQAVLERYDVDLYAAALAAHVRDLAGHPMTPATAAPDRPGCR